MDNIVLLNGESIIKQASEIRFYIGGEILDSGSLTLTNFRILWISSDTVKEIFLNDIISIESTAGFLNVSSPKIILHLVKIQQKTLEILKDWECLICNTINHGKNDKCSECGVKSTRENLNNDGKTCLVCTFINLTGNVCEMCGEQLNGKSMEVKLSFRKGSMPEFLANVQKYWKQKDWDAIKVGNSTMGVGGVSSVLERLHEAKIKDDQVLSTAFSDLKALMTSAQEMVQLATNIAAKVATIKGSDTDTKEVLEFRNSLMTLGINDPVTRGAAKSDYIKKLSGQLEEFLSKYFKSRHPKIISTVDLYCLFNRARGLDLISPQDLMRACELFSSDTNAEYKLRCFEGGAKFLQSTKLNNDDFYARILKLLSEKEYVTSSSVAVCENISIILAKEELLVICKH